MVIIHFFYHFIPKSDLLIACLPFFAHFLVIKVQINGTNKDIAKTVRNSSNKDPAISKNDNNEYELYKRVLPTIHDNIPSLGYVLNGSFSQYSCIERREEFLCREFKTYQEVIKELKMIKYFNILLPLGRDFSFFRSTITTVLFK
jgi:hypothetical protein